MADDPAGRCEFNAEETVLRLETSVAANVAEIDPLVERIMSVARAMQCADGAEFEIETAVREALANAIEHGAGADPSKRIQVAVGCDEHRGMLIVVRDPGSGFDPKDVPSPLHGQQLYASHGRGIYLINELMDDVRFEKGGTEIWMRKRRS